MGLYELLEVGRDPQHNPTYLAKEIEKFYKTYGIKYNIKRRVNGTKV